MKRTFLTALLASALVAGASAQVLSGINWYTTDSAKHFNGGYGNTYGGDSYSKNLYVTENAAVGFAPLQNSQNLTTLPTRVAFNLSAPGTYTFQMYCNGDSSAVAPTWGLNLFFDADDLHPAITAWNAVDTIGFQAISSVGTPTLDPLSMGTATNLNSGLSAIVDGRQITLTDYRTWSAAHYNIDRVADFSDANGLGNGSRDQVIEFTLNVSTVPEPATLIGLGALAVGFFGRRRSGK